jgi:hypothetical protein
LLSFFLLLYTPKRIYPQKRGVWLLHVALLALPTSPAPGRHVHAALLALPTSLCLDGPRTPVSALVFLQVLGITALLVSSLTVLVLLAFSDVLVVPRQNVLPSKRGTSPSAWTAPAEHPVR